MKNKQQSIVPRVTIYIREMDYPTWQAIENKPDWLHEHLAQDADDAAVKKVINKTRLTPEKVKAYEKMSGFETTGEVTRKLTSPETYSHVDRLVQPNKCEHLQPKGSCLVKGCKYGRA